MTFFISTLNVRLELLIYQTRVFYSLPVLALPFTSSACSFNDSHRQYFMKSNVDKNNFKFYTELKFWTSYGLNDG